jgi:hypothetical protein
MAIEVTGTKHQVQRLICTTSEIDLGVSIEIGLDADEFCGWLEKDARLYTHLELTEQLDKFKKL